MKLYTKILVAIDLSEASEQVLSRAVKLADGADLHVVFVSEPIIFYYSPDFDVDLKSVQETLNEVSEKMLKRLGDPVKIPTDHQHVIIGRPATEIRGLAEELQADLIIIGSHGRHGWRLVLGSTANAVMHGAPCDVLAVKIKE